MCLDMFVCGRIPPTSYTRTAENEYYENANKSRKQKKAKNKDAKFYSARRKTEWLTSHITRCVYFQSFSRKKQETRK